MVLLSTDDGVCRSQGRRHGFSLRSAEVEVKAYAAGKVHTHAADQVPLGRRTRCLREEMDNDDAYGKIIDTTVGRGR